MQVNTGFIFHFADANGKHKSLQWIYILLESSQSFPSVLVGPRTRTSDLGHQPPSTQSQARYQQHHSNHNKNCGSNDGHIADGRQCPPRPPKIPRLRNLAITPHQSVAHPRFSHSRYIHKQSNKCFNFIKLVWGHPFKTSALRGGLAQDGRPVTFIFKDKVFIFSRTQLLNIVKIQFEAFKFKECPASPFDIKNMTSVDH